MYAVISVGIKILWKYSLVCMGKTLIESIFRRYHVLTFYNLWLYSGTASLRNWEGIIYRRSTSHLYPSHRDLSLLVVRTCCLCSALSRCCSSLNFRSSAIYCGTRNTDLEASEKRRPNKRYCLPEVVKVVNVDTHVAAQVGPLISTQSKVEVEFWRQVKTVLGVSRKCSSQKYLIK